MGHFIVSSVCFVLWAIAINLVCAGLLLAYKRVTGSALLFTTGIACFAVILGVGICARIDIAHSFRYAGITLALGVPILLRRVQHAEQNSLLKKKL